MTFAQAVFHLLNFTLPALAMAVLMPAAGRWVMGGQGIPWPRRVLWHLLAGVLVGLLQALTSIQEATLTFVPKLAAIIGVFWLSMGFMTAHLVDLFRATFVPVVLGG